MLTDDIDADGAAVSIPIFLGDFDGQGHKITGLCLTESCSEYGLFSCVESGASVRNLTVEGEVIPAGTQTDVGGIVGQMVPDITLRFSSGGLDELQTELNALQSLINRTLDDAQSASDSVTGGVSHIAACADAAQSSAGALSGQLTDFVDANVSSVNNLLLIVERYTAKAAPILDDLSSAAGAAAPDTAQLRADIGALQAVVSTLETTVTRALEEHGAVGARPLRGGLHGLFAARLPIRRGQQHAERLAQRREPRADRSEQ